VVEGRGREGRGHRPLGGKNVVDHVATDGSNDVAITADVSDPAAVTAAIASPSPELSAAMASHGVVPPVAIHLEK
jgi:hypothetical protein